MASRAAVYDQGRNGFRRRRIARRRARTGGAELRGRRGGAPARGSSLIDFTVLTGFLGSGKTTLLRDFLAMQEGAGTAVIVNEVGEIGLDGAILAESAGGLRLAMLANGCVCCALGSDLADTVQRLLESQAEPPRRIVLETSGLSKPRCV